MISGLLGYTVYQTSHTADIIRYVSIFAITGVGTFVSVYLTVWNCSNKYWIYSIATAIILILLFFYIGEFEFTRFDIEGNLILAAIMMSTLITVRITIRQKNEST
jgi:FlaA1/EpsC-like NDP-sugar epimerase